MIFNKISVHRFSQANLIWEHKGTKRKNKYLLFVSKRSHHSSEEHTGAKASHKEHLNIVGLHPVEVIEGVDVRALKPVTSWKIQPNTEITYKKTVPFL